MFSTNSNAIEIAIILGVSLFLFILAFSIVQYDKMIESDRKRKKELSDDWLFHNFYQKIYDMFFEGKDPEEAASMVGIKLEKYYHNCMITRTVPNVKLLVVHFIYGFAALFVGIIVGLLLTPWGLAVGLIIFFTFVYYEQMSLDRKAEAKRRQIEDDLPRFLDLLKTELAIGLPIETAIDILCRKMSETLLAKELIEALNQSELGLDGWQGALENVAQNYDVETLSSFVLDVITSYNKGVSMADAVDRKAKEIHQTYMLTQKERAGKTTNTILFPIAVFQFLPMIAFMLLPTLTSVMTGL